MLKHILTAAMAALYLLTLTGLAELPLIVVPTAAPEAEAPEAEAIEAMPTPEPAQTVEPDAQDTEPDAQAAKPETEPGRLAGIVIGIEPGHQAHGNSQKEAVAPGSREKKAKVSSGTDGVVTDIPEYVTVLEIAFQLRDALLAEGAEVYMTREEHDVDISNQERAKMMNDLGCDLVLRIHCDGADSSRANGIGLYVNESFPISEASYAAAEAILPRMCEATGAKERGIFESDSYTGLNWSEVPCILVECGFMSNPREDELLNTPEYQRLLARGMVEGICDYFGRGE